jgi:hypothetical protein
VDLSAIASVGSACSLMIFLLVGVSGYRLRAETGARGWIVAVAMAATAVVLVFFAIDTLRNAPETFAAHRRDRCSGRGPRRRLEAHAQGASPVDRRGPADATIPNVGAGRAMTCHVEGTQWAE